MDEAEYKYANMNECIESTLNIVWNELKYKTTLKKDYGDIPLIKCYPQQMNQVFMNLLINASHAIEKQGDITIRTWDEDQVRKIFITISDTGHGIAKEIFNKIFEPFFTTKEVGKGTGLGLSITYEIIQRRQWGDYYRTGEPVKGYDLELIKKGGTKVFNEISVSLIRNSEGKPIGFRGISRDVTERKQAEEALKKNQEELLEKNREIEASRRGLQLALEELEKAYKELKATQAKILQQEKMASIGQLAAGVAHEINNPMAFISSNLGTLDKYVHRLTGFIQTQSEVIESLHATDAIEELNRKQKELKLDYIIEDIKGVITESLDGSERVQKIVQGLRSFARVDEAEYKYANMNECIESTLNIVWNELKYKATLKKDYGNIPLTKCYPQQMNQVFMNLLINAGHAIEKQGEITIKTRDEDGSIVIAISDTGCGIAKEHLNKIFEPFFTTKEVGKGTGLGLSITYEIVQRHNGEITVESEIGKGTTFTVKIPIV